MRLAMEFQFVHLASLSANNLEREAREHRLPALSESIAALERLSRIEGEAGARSYLYDLLRSRSFTFTSPTTGKQVRSGSSAILHHVTTAVVFGFPDSPDLLVAATMLGEGFPLTAILNLERRIVISQGDPVWGLNRGHIAALAQLLDSWNTTHVNEEPMFLLGEQNFAHYGFNQLPAIRAVVDLSGIARPILYSTHQPLGAVSSLFPEISWREKRIPLHEIVKRNRPGALFVPLGSRRLTIEIVRRVTSLARARRGEEATEIEKSILVNRNWPVLWVSVRTQNRTASNQIELLSALCDRFLSEYPRGAVIVDGMSLPADFDEGEDLIYSGEFYRGTIALDRAVAQQLASERPDRIYVAVGMSILDSIALARNADFYFCHHGTVQHKIGLFHTTPGVVHSNRAILAYRQAADWIASLSAVATKPIYLLEDIVTDAKLEANNEFARRLHQEMYTADVARSVEFTIEYLRGAISRP